MADHSKIEWTEATWNPVRGCAVVSPGCTNCYAMRQAHRFSAPGKAYAGLTKLTKGGPVWTGEVRTVPELLDAPLHWKTPRRIFVNSMSDLFHEDVPDKFIDWVFTTIKRCDVAGRGHIFQILTKRAERMQRFLVGVPMMRNVWLGVSVEDQRRADERIPMLMGVPAAVRWISAEPLLGPIELSRIDSPSLQSRLDWVVVGGESGPGARPFDIAWARALRDQCRAAGVPFFLKQLGANVAPVSEADKTGLLLCPKTGGATPILTIKDRKGGDPMEWPKDLRVREYPA